MTQQTNGAPQQRCWTTMNVEGARSYAHAALGSAMRAANELAEAVARDPELAVRVGPLAERLYAAADGARLVEHELAAVLAERRRELPKLPSLGRDDTRAAMAPRTSRGDG